MNDNGGGAGPANESHCEFLTRLAALHARWSTFGSGTSKKFNAQRAERYAAIAKRLHELESAEKARWEGGKHE